MSTSPHRQRGATLMIALMMLLIITLLAISSMRETTLEARMTGSVIEQKRLFNSAESGLRDAEKRFAELISAPDKCAKDMDIQLLCILDRAPTYVPNFSGSVKYRGSDGETEPDRVTQWHALLTPLSDDPNGLALTGHGKFYYEINSNARNGKGVESTLRSVVVRDF